MDSQPDHLAHDHELYSGRKLKIRRFPSCKVSAPPSSAPKSSSSLQYRSRSTTVNQQPLIIHTFDPEIIVTEPDEFMWLVQRLTGSPDTRRSLRASKRKRTEVQPMQVQDVQSLQESSSISLKKLQDTKSCAEAAAPIMTGDSSCVTSFSRKDQPSSPLSSNSSDLSSNCINPLGLPLSSDTNYQLNFRIISPPTASNYANYYSKLRSKYPASSPNYIFSLVPLTNPSPLTINTDPSPPLSPNSATNPSTPTSTNTNPSPLSLNPRDTITINYTNPSPSFPSPSTLIINNKPSPPSPNPANISNDPINDSTSPLSSISCNSGIFAAHLSIVKPMTDHERTNRCHVPGSPSSPASGLTTSSEDCHTDLKTESCASPGEEAFSPKQGSNMEAEHEDGSNFFLFSLNSYYGSQAAQDDLDFMHSTVDSSCSSMTLTPTEAFNLSLLKDLATWLPMMDESNID